MQVEELAQHAQDILRKYTTRFGDGSVDTRERALPWGQVDWQDYADLAEISEYASWVLINGYSLNHATVSVHRLPGFR